MHESYTFYHKLLFLSDGSGNHEFYNCMTPFPTSATYFGITWEDGWTNDNGRQPFAKGHLSDSGDSKYMSSDLCY